MFLRFRQRKKILLVISLLALLTYIYHSFQHKHRPRFAIAQYATNRQYLCNALINVARLRRFGTTAELVVLLPFPYLQVNPSSPIGRLTAALKKREVELVGFDLALDSIQDVTYADSFQKLGILKMTRYQRILYFDNDGLVLKNPDHLLETNTETDLLMPEAYYTDRTEGSVTVFSSALMVLTPSLKLHTLAQQFIATRGAQDFDMEIMNKVSSHPTITFAKLPYHHNLLLTGLFKDHASYSPDSGWNAREEYERAMYIHFSDSPMPKPWVDDRGASFARWGPKCPSHEPDCEDVRVWREVHNAFKDEMRELCPTAKELDV